MGCLAVQATWVAWQSNHVRTAHIRLQSLPSPCVPNEGPVQGETVQVPQLDRLVRAGGGQLLAVGADEALEDVGRVCAQLVQGLKVGQQGGACRPQEWRVEARWMGL